MDIMAFFLTMFKNGLLQHVLPQYLVGANMMPFAKEDSKKPRPVAVGEVFYSIVTGFSLNDTSDVAAEELVPIQLGQGIKGGVEIAVHYANAIVTDAFMKNVGILTDFSNAFNERDIFKMLNALY